VKGNFFNPGKVLAAMDKATAKALTKAGAFVRTSAKSSLRYAKKASIPGQPPKVHRGNSFQRSSVNKKTGQVVKRSVSPLKELIYFAYSTETRSVVIGPMEFRASKNAKYKVPSILERGGTGSQIVYKWAGKGQRVPSSTVVTISKRPYMRPALDKNIPKFPGVFAGSVKG
jgi:hypothetical protein